MTRLLADLLRERVRRAPGAPVVTYYDLRTGERTELSATTFANWVDKTSNLLVDELMIDAGDPIELVLAALAPGHWVTAVWELACWQVGATLTLGRASEARLCVAGPDWPAYAGQGLDLVACALHPLGLGFPDALPAGVFDYALEVRSQPDHFGGPSRTDSEPAWLDPDRTLTQLELVSVHPTLREPGATRAEPVEAPIRRLVRPTDPWTTAYSGIITALVTGGSLVTVVGDDEAAIARIRTTERTS